MSLDVIVVTGGGEGIGKAISEHLLAKSVGVVVMELESSKVEWLNGHIQAHRARVVVGNAGLDSVEVQAVAAARELGTLTGWVNNAAIF